MDGGVGDGGGEGGQYTSGGGGEVGSGVVGEYEIETGTSKNT